VEVNDAALRETYANPGPKDPFKRRAGGASECGQDLSGMTAQVSDANDDGVVDIS
jgi:hypothetical protein